MFKQKQIRWRFDFKAVCTALVVLVGAKAQAFVGNPSTGWLSAAEYLAARQVNPYVSPFKPWFDPQPMLDFEPYPVRPKPAIKTPQELANWGYIIWQQFAIKEKFKALFDPFTGEWVGSRYDRFDWNVGLGYRISGWQTLGGQFTEWDSNWGFSGSNRVWERQLCGQAYEYQPGISDSSGFLADVETDTDSGWRIRNFANQTQPNFEIAVAWDCKHFPWGMHKHDAYSSGELKDHLSWRVVVLPPGSTRDITPGQMEVPQNYEFKQDPYIIWDMKSVASNNAELPEWVEGWEN